MTITFKKLFLFSNPEVQDAFKRATCVARYSGLKLLQASATEPFGRLLIVTPKKSGKANKRNLFRRRVKAIFYLEKLYLKPVDSILLVSNKAIDLPFETLKMFLIKTLS